MVFLKYYHADTLMAAIERQHAAATHICTMARVVLAKRHMQKLRDHREQAIRLAKAKAEREARERARKEEIERGLAAAAEAERKAKEAAAAMSAKLEQQRQVTMQRKRAEADQLAAEAAIAKAEAEAKVARESAERLERESAAEMARAEAEDAELVRKQVAAAAAEEEGKVQRRKKAADEFSKAQRNAKLNNRMSAIDLVGNVASTPGAAHMMDGASGGAGAGEHEMDLEDAFSELLSDEGIDAEQRERLAGMAAKRRAEDVRRRQVLSAIHAEEEQKRAEARMRELNEIAEEERKLQEDREAAAVDDTAEMEARLAEMDFSFSWGPDPTPAEPKPASAVATPAPASPQKEEKPTPAVANRPRKSFLGNVFGSKKGTSSSTGAKKRGAIDTTSPTSSPPTSPTADSALMPPVDPVPSPKAAPAPAPVPSAATAPTTPPPPIEEPAIEEPDRKFSSTKKKKKAPPTAPRASQRAASHSAPTPPARSDSVVSSIHTLSSESSASTVPTTTDEIPRSLSRSAKNKKNKPLPQLQQSGPPAAPRSSTLSVPEGDRIKCTLTRSESGSFGIGISSIPGTGNIKVSSLESRHGATGLCISDVIIEVNGTPVTGSGHLVVLGLIKKTDGDLTLVVVRKRSDSLRSKSAAATQASPIPTSSVEPSTPSTAPSAPPTNPKPEIPAAQKPTMSPAAATAPPAPATAPAPAKPGEPRRRKLVRGGNAKKTEVLPEYTLALEAIADLDKFLDEAESADKDLAAETEMVTGSMRRSGTIRKRDSINGETKLTRKVTTPEGVQALEDVLLIGTSPKRNSELDQRSISPHQKSKFEAGAATLNPADSTRRGSARARTESQRQQSNVDIKGYSLNTADILSMDENERIALLERVKSGEMSINDALQEVIEHKRRQNCVVM
jgi:myosin-3